MIIVVGVCSHRFHMHCIVRWLEVETSKNLCPMCRRTFEAQDQDDDEIQDEGTATKESLLASQSSVILD